MSKDRKTFEQAAREIDFGLGDVLGHLGSALDEVVSRLSEAEDGGEIRREKNFETKSGPVRASAGLRIRTLGGSTQTGTARAPDQPINPRRAATGAKPQESAAPDIRLVEATIFREANTWMLVADMPGITQEEVTWARDGTALRLEGRSATRHYRVDTDWPEGAAEEQLVCTVANGIVELRTAEAQS